MGASGSSSGGAAGAPTLPGTGGEGAAGDPSDAGTTPIDDVPDSGPTLLDDGGGAGSGGAAGTDGGAPSDAGSEENEPAIWICDGDYAFGSDASLEFMEPTPPALASALTAVNGPTHAVSLVWHLEDDALIGGISATVEDGTGQHMFFPSDVPLAPVVAAFGSPPGVTSVDAQPNATLHFEDEAGGVDIEVEHVVWRATQGASCADMTVSFQAVIPTSQLSVVLHLPTGGQTIGELVTASGPAVTPIGSPEPTPIPVEIAATFKGVPLDFAFDAL